MNENTKIICDAIFSIYEVSETSKKEIEEKIVKLSEDEVKKLIKNLVDYKEGINKLNSEFKKSLEFKIISLTEFKERKQAFYEAENLINNI